MKKSYSTLLSFFKENLESYVILLHQTIRISNIPYYGSLNMETRTMLLKEKASFVYINVGVSTIGTSCFICVH